MSETKLFPAKFSRLDKQDSVPREALWFQFWCVSAISIGANVIAHVVPNFDPYTFLGEVFGVPVLIPGDSLRRLPDQPSLYRTRFSQTVPHR